MYELYASADEIYVLVFTAFPVSLLKDYCFELALDLNLYPMTENVFV